MMKMMVLCVHYVIVMSLKVWQQVSLFGSIVTSVAAGYIIIVLSIRRTTLPVDMCAQAAHSLTASVAISCSILID